MSGSALAIVVETHRKRARMTVATLIQLSELSKQTVYAVINGTGHPKTETLLALARALASRSLEHLVPDSVLTETIYAQMTHAIARQAVGGDGELSTAAEPDLEMSPESPDNHPILGKRFRQVSRNYKCADPLSRQWIERLLDVLGAPTETIDAPEPYVPNLFPGLTWRRARESSKQPDKALPDPALTQTGRGRNAPIPTVIWHRLRGNDDQQFIRLSELVGVPREQTDAILHLEFIPELSVLHSLALVLSSRQVNAYDPDPLKADEIYLDLSLAKERQEQEQAMRLRKQQELIDEPPQHQGGAAS